jgi:glycosyltransferase involved in cell wall biosynthesis
MLLSIGMMIKNEEKHLRECLQSLMPLLDNIESELIIIDTGSTDDSVNIAKTFTDKVFFHPWNDDFSEIRNKVISYCTGEWIMVIDGDEVLDSPNEIINFMKSKDIRKFNTALMIVKNLTDENNLSSFSMLSSPRLFRIDSDLHYEGTVHNQPIFKAPIIKLDCSIIHYGYISTDKELMERKFIRTTSLLEKELKRDPSNFYYWCQLSVSYAMHNDHEKAMDFGIKAYEALNDSGLNKQEYIYVYMQLAYTYLMNKEYRKAVEICLEGIAIKSGILDLYFYLAKAQMMTKEYKSAIENYKEYLNLIESIGKFDDTNVSLYTSGKYEYAYYDLVVGLEVIEDYESAFVYCKKITDEKLIALNLNNLIYICLKTGNYNYMHEYYNKNVVRLNLQDGFQVILENYLKELFYEKRFEVAKSLKDIDGLYGLLNNVRCSIIENKELDFEINNYLQSNVDFNDLSDYYGDFLYYLIMQNADICNLLSNVRELEFNRFFVYLNKRYDDFGKKVFTYLKEFNFNEDKSTYRIKKALERYALLTAQLNDEDFIEIFNQFIEDGTAYINKIYSSNIILNEDIYELKNEEEGFLLYMSKAILVKDSDKKSYIEYLRKALKIYPYMRRGIEYLLNEFNDETDVVNNELEQYKIQVKNTIKSLIENNRLEDAENIISEYEKIINNDMEIVLFKSQISVAKFKKVNANDYKM